MSPREVGCGSDLPDAGIVAESVGVGPFLTVDLEVKPLRLLIALLNKKIIIFTVFKVRETIG
mgnify:CR=1 FL=1